MRPTLTTMKFNNTNWFIDYSAININCNYLGKWKHEDHKIFQQYNEQLLEEYIYLNFKELIKHDIKPIFIFYNKNDIKIEFKGSFFKGKSIKKDIESLHKHYNEILKYTLFSTTNKYNQALSINGQTVYRIDTSTNIPSITLDNITFTGKYNKGFQTRSYQWDRRELHQKKITGWDVGQRGRKNIQLKIYLKYYDKNKKHDIIRFGTDDFTRIEYEIGAEQCQNFGFKTPKELLNWRPRKWKNLLLKVHENKEYIIPNRTIIFNEDYKNSRLPKFNYPPESKYYGLETAKGIIDNKLTEEEIRKLYSYINKVYL